MRKHIFTLFIWIVFIFSAHAMPVDTLRWLSPGDTVILEVNDYGEKIYTHVFEEGQTLWSIARYYGLKPEELKRFNSIFEGQIFNPGDKIRVPIPNKAIIRFENIYLDKTEHAQVYYVVKKGDTKFGIAQRQYKMPVDTLERRNNCAGVPLQPGQLLHTGWISVHGVPDSLQNHNAYISYDKDSRIVQEFERKNRSYKQRGPAIVLQTKGGNNMAIALHNTAKVGSKIEIYNPMTNRTIYAKVTGKIPRGAHDPDVVVLLSAAAARQLGAKDARFFVALKY